MISLNVECECSSSTSCDLLGSILSSQKVLLAPSNHITVGDNGVIKPNNQFKIEEKKQLRIEKQKKKEIKPKIGLIEKGSKIVKLVKTLELR